MNVIEHYLTCLAEEGSEVAQRATKALRFGVDEVQPGQPLSNAARLVADVKDVMAVAIILWEDGELPDPLPTRDEIEAKRAKIEHFMAISRREGTLT